MARNWRKYYKRRYRKYYKNKYGNNYSSRGYGQMKAAKQQADQASFVMNIPTQISCKCVKGTIGNRQVELGTYPMNIYDLLRKSEFYQSYANMYDEFKIDNIKVKLIPVKYNVTVGDANNAGYQSFTVYTAWDRTGLNGKQLFLNTASGVYNNEPINPNSPNGAKNYDYIGKPGDYDGIYCLVGSDITTYSSAESRQVSVGQNSSIVRWLKPKTLSEKSQWLSTSQLKAWYNQYSNVDAMFRYIPTSNMNSYMSDISRLTNLADRSIGAALNSISPAVANNPCFLEEDPSVSFKPTLLVGLYPADAEDTELPRTVFFNVETEVSCSFRGLRKSKVVNNEEEFIQPPQPQPGEIDLEPLNVSQFGNYARGDPSTEGFNPVSVAPAAGSYVHNVFDENELSEQELQNMAIQSLPGESEVHYINTEIPHQQNDYIPSATLTKYRVGHYQYTQNGTHLMSYADRDVDPENPTVWVIPGVIDINVPVPQIDPNENVIEVNGIYNLVDNDDDPEIEIEPASSNSTENPNVNRGTLVEAKKTIKTLKLEKQEEGDQAENARDARDTPVSLGQIRVQVPQQAVTPTLQNKTVTISTRGNQTITADNGYDGLDEVTINNTTNVETQTSQSLTYNNSTTAISENGITTLSHSITPTSPNYATQSVNTTSALKNETITISQPGTSTYMFDGDNYLGFGEITVNASFTPNLENKTIPITQNGTAIVTYDSDNYDGLGTVTINTQVPSSGNLGNNSWRITYGGTEINIAQPDWQFTERLPDDHRDIIINVNNEDSHEQNYPYHVVIFMIINDNYQPGGGGISDASYVGCYGYACAKPMEILVENFWRPQQAMSIWYSVTVSPNSAFRLSNQYNVNSFQHFDLPYIEKINIDTDQDPFEYTMEVNARQNFLNCNQSIHLDM